MVDGGRRRTPREIAEALRERIRAGELKAGDRLPTQAELAAEFGVERAAVRQALRALQGDGLLTHVSKGSPPRVAEAASAGRDEPRPAMVALAPRLVAAFDAPRVRIDVVCLTAETLMVAMGEPLRLVHEDRLRPRAVDVRVLLPSRTINLAFPAPVDGTDESVHERWLARRNAQGHVLRHNLYALRATHGIEVNVTFRALPFTPPVKLFLLDGQEALMAYYQVGRREERTDHGPTDLYDVLDAESLLFSFERDGGPREAAFVEQSQKWFDALWETITSDLDLG